MKKSFIFILLLGMTTFAQSVSVRSIKQITTLEHGRFFYPLGNLDDSKILFSSENYKGLWLLDNATKEIEQLNDCYSAGYEPIFTTDNNIIYRKDSFEKQRRYISIYEYNVVEKRTEAIEENLRGISQIRVTADNKINYTQNGKLLRAEAKVSLVKVVTSHLPLVMIENSNLVLYKDGEKNVLNPFGDGHYLWASVSPDREKLLFTFAGHGSFITDLSGNVIKEIGFAHYPQWSSDGNWIVYMKDYDDGERIIKSDLYVVAVNKPKEFKITDTNDTHEMYPIWAKSKNTIYCNSSDGIIYQIDLKIN